MPPNCLFDGPELLGFAEVNEKEQIAHAGLAAKCHRQFQPRHVQYVLLILQPMIHRDLHLHMSTRPLTSVSVSTTRAIAMSASVEAQAEEGQLQTVDMVVTSLNLW